MNGNSDQTYIIINELHGYIFRSVTSTSQSTKTWRIFSLISFWLSRYGWMGWAASRARKYSKATNA